ncbi:MAG: FAD-dependent monooxygenase, partial [Nitriliruptorales bacterium]
MQFHLDGFRPGDPETSEPSPDAVSRSSGDLPDEVDVLIVGCGPAGLTLAAQLSAFPDITTRIVEQKPGRLLLGQADGIAVRTLEMFEAFGFSERVLKEAYWVNETTFWKPDDGRPETIVRGDRIQDTEDGLSEFPHVILNQARVHDFFLDVMADSPRRLEPDYSCRVVDLEIDRTTDHPVAVTIERADPEREGEVVTVRARYLVGCDGAHSTVRKLMGRTLHGDAANRAWGVMDVLAVTDFPDIRLKSTIHSSSQGNLLIIPREGGYLVRLYVELDELKEGERIAARNITADHLVAAAQRILHPYSLEVHEIAWWSVYEIGQRLCDRFDDETDERMPHVFIAGDACHTHSPKAGQGMNVSMRDTFNLGWKLAAVIRGRSSPRLLRTYSTERRAVAKELIDFDREFARMFSARPKAADADGEGVDPAEFQQYFVRKGRFTAGTETRYRPSIITAEATFQHLAKGFVIGMRFHSAPVVRLADAKPVHLGHVVKADGRWRVFAFAGAEDPASVTSRIRALCDFLAEDPRSPVTRFT